MTSLEYTKNKLKTLGWDFNLENVIKLQKRYRNKKARLYYVNQTVAILMKQEQDRLIASSIAAQVKTDAPKKRTRGPNKKKK